MTNIEWTDVTWNPTTGCTKVSKGCRNCYAETVASRFWGDRKFTDVLVHPERLDQPLRWRKPRRVFVDSMSDLFHEAVPDEFIDRVFAVMALAPQHTFQVLTKRPERMLAYLNGDDVAGGWTRHDRWSNAGAQMRPDLAFVRGQAPMVLPNVELGVSIEDQQSADRRVHLLLRTPAAVRFVSAEPLLGPIDLRFLQPGDPATEIDALSGTHGVLRPHRGRCDRLDWVIVGGESGHDASPCDVAWIRSIVAQCRDALVPCFVKQLGALPFVGDGRHTHVVGNVSHGVHCDQGDPCPHCGRHPITQWPRLPLQDRKGGDPAEWPDDLRVRQFPEATPQRGDHSTAKAKAEALGHVHQTE